MTFSMRSVLSMSKMEQNSKDGAGGGGAKMQHSNRMRQRLTIRNWLNAEGWPAITKQDPILPPRGAF